MAKERTKAAEEHERLQLEAIPKPQPSQEPAAGDKPATGLKSKTSPVDTATSSETENQ